MHTESVNHLCLLSRGQGVSRFSNKGRGDVMVRLGVKRIQVKNYFPKIVLSRYGIDNHALNQNNYIFWSELTIVLCIPIKLNDVTLNNNSKLYHA